MASQFDSVDLTSIYIEQKDVWQKYSELFDKKDSKRVLNIYGVGGVGKSTFSKRIKKFLQEQYSKSHNEIIYTKVDLENAQNQTKAEFLATLSINLRKNHGIEFLSFWTARAILWQKRNPGVVIDDQSDHKFIKQLEDITTLTGIFDGGIGSALTKIFSYVSSKTKRALEDKVKNALNSLQNKSAQEIEDELYLYFTYDLDSHLETYCNSCQVAIIFDTHENLWRQGGREHLHPR